MNNKANVKVDASKSIGTLSHNWNYIGMDECNYIFEPEGKAILEEFGRFSEKNVLCTAAFPILQRKPARLL